MANLSCYSGCVVQTLRAPTRLLVGGRDVACCVLADAGRDVASYVSAAVSRSLQPQPLVPVLPRPFSMSSPASSMDEAEVEVAAEASGSCPLGVSLSISMGSNWLR